MPLAEGNRPDWKQPPAQLVSQLENLALKSGEYRWNYTPFSFVTAREPDSGNILQQVVITQVVERLSSPYLGNTHLPTAELYNDKLKLENRPRLAIIAGTGQWDGLVNDNLEFYSRLPKPKPLMLLVNTVDHLPDGVDYDSARRQIVRGAAHNGVIFAGDQKGETVRRALWVSTQGNFAVIEGTEEQIYDDVVLRILIHYGAKFVTNRQDYYVLDDEQPLLSWEDWSRSPVHSQVWQRAQALASRGLIEDKVDLERFATRSHVSAIMRAINRSALGESMRGALDADLGILAVTRSGGGKVKWSSDPKMGDLVPVSHITRDGYVVAVPDGGGISVDSGSNPIRYADGSVETRESAMIAIAYQLVQKGKVKTYGDFHRWLYEQFRLGDNLVAIRQADFLPGIHIDHIHWHAQPGSFDPNRLEIVSPDPGNFPERDLPCGSESAAMATINALFQSSAFTSPGPTDAPLRGKVIAVQLPGHGLVLVANKSEAISDTVLKGMHPIKPPSV